MNSWAEPFGKNWSTLLSHQSILKSFAVTLGLCGLGSVVYRRFSGYWPLQNELDEWFLNRTSLQQLEGEFHANPRRSHIVVSLSTIPSRIDKLESTLKSLLRQTRRPAEIRLNVPSYSHRENRPYEIPDWLAQLESVTLVDCQDYGPATKLIPSVLSLAPRQSILVLDDDRIYPPALVDDMHRLGEAHPDWVISSSGWRVPEDLTDRPTTLKAVLKGAKYVPLLASVIRRPCNVDVVQGVHGYLVQPRFFDKQALVDYSQAPEAARFCDDVWLSAQARAPKFVFPMTRLGFQPLQYGDYYKATSLARNFNSKPDDDKRANTIMIRHFAKTWPLLRAEGA